MHLKFFFINNQEKKQYIYFIKFLFPITFVYKNYKYSLVNFTRESMRRGYEVFHVLKSWNTPFQRRFITESGGKRVKKNEIILKRKESVRSFTIKDREI